MLVHSGDETVASLTRKIPQALAPPHGSPKLDTSQAKDVEAVPIRRVCEPEHLFGARLADIQFYERACLQVVERHVYLRSRKMVSDRGSPGMVSGIKVEPAPSRPRIRWTAGRCGLIRMAVTGNWGFLGLATLLVRIQFRLIASLNSLCRLSGAAAHGNPWYGRTEYFATHSRHFAWGGVKGRSWYRNVMCGDRRIGDEKKGEHVHACTAATGRRGRRCLRCLGLESIPLCVTA